MPETPFDPQMLMGGAFSESAAIKAHSEMLNQSNVLRSDRDTWRRLCREAQAEVDLLRGLLDAVLFEAGLQAHSIGCENRLIRTRRGTVGPCRGCAAEAALAAAKGE